MSNGCSAVLFAKEYLAVAKFYREVVGMRKLKGDKDHVLLACGAFQLIVHRIAADIARNIVIDTPPSVRQQTPIKLGLPVTNLAKARASAAKLGGAVYAPDHEWRYRDRVVCDGYDPEGNVFQLYQPLSARPARGRRKKSAARAKMRAPAGG